MLPPIRKLLPSKRAKFTAPCTTKFGHLLGLDTSVSETVRAMAEKVVDQSRKDKMAGIVSERDLIKEFPRCYR
jgi:hypothetical protein